MIIVYYRVIDILTLLFSGIGDIYIFIYVIITSLVYCVSLLSFFIDRYYFIIMLLFLCLDVIWTCFRSAALADITSIPNLR